MIESKTTPFGFKFGAADVIRRVSDDRKGCVVILVETPKTTVQIYVTRSGLVRVNGVMIFKPKKGPRDEQ